MKIFVWCPDRLIGGLVAHRLQAQGTTVADASSTTELYDKASNHEPEAIIVHYKRPITDYCNIIHQLKKDHTVEKHAVYILSWVQYEETVIELINAGADEYMTFPLNLGRLLNKLNTRLTL